MKKAPIKTVFTPQRTQAGWDLNRINYRKLQNRNVKCTDVTTSLKDFRIIGYVAGTMVRMCDDLTWDHFDWASPIEKSTNPINRREVMVFIGTRDAIKTVLITEKK